MWCLEFHTHYFALPRLLGWKSYLPSTGHRIRLRLWYDSLKMSSRLSFNMLTRETMAFGKFFSLPKQCLDFSVEEPRSETRCWIVISFFQVTISSPPLYTGLFWLELEADLIIHIDLSLGINPVKPKEVHYYVYMQLYIQLIELVTTSPIIICPSQ